jgi:short subunit dehydrogenase-like uncharacterized protein
MERDFDIVLFGATGFTGRLCALRLARKADSLRLRFAIAGRNAAKLAEIQAEITAAGGPAVEAIAVASDDEAGLTRMAARTSVIMSTVGPFDRLGDPLVAACVASKTDYCDITGEPRFVDRMIARHDEQARVLGIRIVNCCGFDSIPPDLGAQMVVEQLPEGVPIKVEGFVGGGGNFSGGTWQSAIAAFGRDGKPSERPPRIETPGRTIHRGKAKFRYVPEISGWASPLPTIDTSIVLRSARALDRYGPEFSYAHHARFSSAITMAGTATGVVGVVVLAQLAPGRKLLARYRPSGEGPSEEQRAKAKFRVTLVGEGGGKKVIGEVSGGDPGYDETSKMLVESALCLAFDPIPDRRSGVITPATAMGKVLRERLIAEGMRFAIVG